MSETPDFPVYRKYHNNSSFFKIISSNQFEEVKKLPDGFSHFIFEAKILPDRNYIQDMLYNYDLHWEVIEKEEFDEMKSRT